MRRRGNGTLQGRRMRMCMNRADNFFFKCVTFYKWAKLILKINGQNLSSAANKTWTQAGPNGIQEYCFS